MDKVVNQEKVRRYVLKPGTKKSLAAWREHRVDSFLSGESAADFEERVTRVERAIEALGLDPHQGAWWNILNQAGYDGSRAVFAREVPREVADRIRRCVADSWYGHFARQGITPEFGVPHWISGQAAVQALRRAGTTGEELLLGEAGREVFNFDTGEVVELSRPD